MGSSLKGRRGCLVAGLSGRICQLESKHGGSNSLSEAEDRQLQLLPQHYLQPRPT